MVLLLAVDDFVTIMFFRRKPVHADPAAMRKLF